MSGRHDGPAVPPPPASEGMPALVPLDDEGGRLAHRAGTVAVYTLASRVLGYVRDAVLANAFGAGVVFDAFIAAQTIPNVLRRLVAEGTLMIAFVPLLSSERSIGGLPAMQRFTGAVLGVLVPVLLVLVGLGAAFPGVAVDLFASGFDAPRAELARELTRVMMPFLFFVSLTAVVSGALNVVGVFGPPAAAPILFNVSMIVAVVAFGQLFSAPIDAAAWGFTLGGVAQLALQLPYLARRGLLVWPRLDLGHPTLRLLLQRMLPALFGVGVYQLNMIVIRQLASFLPRGQLSCYFYASRLEEFALGVFAVSISVAALPTLSEHAARKDPVALFATFGRALRATTYVCVPAMAGLVVLAEPIVGTLFRHGAFDVEAARLTAQLTLIMAFVLVPVGAIRVLVPTYYAIGDTRTPVVAATLSMLTTAGLGVLLTRYEIQGLTWATIVAGGVQAWVLLARLGSRVRALVGTDTSTDEVGPSVVHAIRCVAAVLPGAVGAAWIAGSRTWLDGRNVENALFLALLGLLLGGSYLGLSRLLGIAEGTLVLGAVTRRLAPRGRR